MSPLSKPTTNVLIPNGLTPPLCVYRCCTPATYLVMYSIVTGSSTVNRWLCASNLALSTKIRASAFSPANAKYTCESMRPIFDGVIRVSCSFMADRFSHPSTTTSAPLTPTAQVPRLTASRAYSTWNTCPSGLCRESQLCYAIRDRSRVYVPEDLEIVSGRFCDEALLSTHLKGHGRRNPFFPKAASQGRERSGDRRTQSGIEQSCCITRLYLKLPKLDNGVRRP